MGGGLFGTPLYLNPKCLVFSGLVLLVYWAPHATHLAHRIVVAFALATAAYIGMAWYDYLYDCTDRFGPTFLGWLSMPFKPAEYREKYAAMPVKYQKLVRDVDILMLIAGGIALALPWVLAKKT